MNTYSKILMEVGPDFYNLEYLVDIGWLASEA